MNDIQKSYDELPYISAAFAETSPARLEALASFFIANSAAVQNG